MASAGQRRAMEVSRSGLGQRAASRPAGQPASSAASERGAKVVQYGTGETLRRNGGGELGTGRRCHSGVHARLLPALASCSVVNTSY